MNLGRRLFSPPDRSSILPLPSSNLFGASRFDGVRNPTVLLALASLTCWMVGIAWFVWHPGAWPISTAINSLALYLGFTVLHDSVHGIAHRNKRVNRILGSASGFLLTFCFPFFKSIHMQHHFHANDREKDPDALLKYLPRWLAPIAGGSFVYFSYYQHFVSRRLWNHHLELIEVLACNMFYMSILGLAITSGTVRELVILWVGPLVITLHWLVYTFDYLPHVPHSDTDRLHCANAYGGKMLSALHLNQNLHLVHHLWPRIPWFNYPEAYRQNLQFLIANGCNVPIPARLLD